MQTSQILIAILLLCYSSCALASSYINVVTEDWPPFNYLDENGKIIGSSTQTVRKVFEKANIQYDIRLYPWARSYEMVQSDPNTMIYSILKTPEREKLFQWVCPISKGVELYFYKLKKRNDLTINSIDQAKKYNTGVTRNDFPHVKLKQLGFEDQQLLVTPEDRSNIIMLLNERIDFVVESASTMESVLKSTKFTMDDVVATLPLNDEVTSINCMAFSLKTDKKIVERVRQALTEYQQQGHNSDEAKAKTNQIQQ